MASMASAPKDADEDGKEKENSAIVVGDASCSSLKHRSSTGTNANIYTPLLMSNKSSDSSSLLSTQNITSPLDDNEILKKETLKPVSVDLKKSVNKTAIELRSQNSRAHRSPVKPFFCCGSELSLVSLVDGIELKDTSGEKKFTSIECSSSSEEEESAVDNVSSRTSSVSFTGQGISGGGERRHTVVRRKKKDKQSAKKKFWSLRFRGRWNPRWRVSQPQRCVSHRCDHSHHGLGSGCQGTYQSTESPGSGRRSPRSRPISSTSQLIDLSRVQDFDRLYPIDDIDTIRRRERAEEMASGVEVDPQLLSRTLQQSLGISGSMLDILRSQNRLGSVNSDTLLHSPDSPTEDYSLLMSNIMWQWHGPRNNSVTDGSVLDSPRIHTQVDFIHCLVPCLINILACPFYWGVMDRYEAERLLDNKPEGTFLLRDSAQEDFLFSVSFRRYNRSLHARVEQWNHRFSFDAHDPAVFSAPSVCELMEHYKDPSCCMFFEPMLTQPLPRNFPFSLQHICRAVICDRLGYDQIRSLPLPNSLKQFLQFYHYKQKVRVRRFDGPEMSYADTSLVM